MSVEWVGQVELLTRLRDLGALDDENYKRCVAAVVSAAHQPGATVVPPSALPQPAPAPKLDESEMLPPMPIPMVVDCWHCPNNHRIPQHANRCLDCGFDRIVGAIVPEGRSGDHGRDFEDRDQERHRKDRQGPPRPHDRDGWRCSTCDTDNDSSRRDCARCGKRTDHFDWDCRQCKYTNFSRRNECKRCGAVKNQPPRHNHPEGDWQCPKGCGNNFSRRTECFKCRTPRP